MCFPSPLSLDFCGCLWALWGGEALGSRGTGNYSYSAGMLGFLVWSYLGAKEGYEKGRAASP